MFELLHKPIIRLPDKLPSKKDAIKDLKKLSVGLSVNADQFAADAFGVSKKNNRISQPYIIQVYNPFNDPVNAGTFIDIGDSLSVRTGTQGSFTNGSYSPTDNTGFTISSLVSGVSYLDFLAQTENQPFRVGKTLVIVTSGGAAAQFAQGITLTHRDASGVRHDEPIVGLVDPYQNQTDRYLYEGEYLFDGFTRIRFNYFNALTTVVIYLYPVDKFSATQKVAGRNEKLNYAEPSVTKVNG